MIATRPAPTRHTRSACTIVVPPKIATVL